jgi:23S rRNA (cytosine1962-C5)-methyltransferase
MPTVRLKPGHVQPVWTGHPWVYAQAVDRIDGEAVHGDEVLVLDPRGNSLGKGFYSPGSAIAVRLLTRDPGEPLERAFFEKRIERARLFRAQLGLPSDETTGYRLIHAEGDALPGLIVDVFGDVLCVQFLTAGMKRREALVLDALEGVMKPRAIVDRTPPATAKAERFDAASGPVRGERIDALAFSERGFRYRIPLDLGQKTGFYFDQRGLRARVGELAHGKRVLDAYAFVGSFALAAARGGATQVDAVDESAVAVAGEAVSREHGFDERIAFHKADARKFLHERAEANARYDLVVLDPPRLAPSRGSRDHALVAYSKLAEAGARLTTEGGTLVLCSCSAAVDLHALTRALATGALHARKQAFVWERHFQGPDHPVNAAFPEGLYLKALVARIEAR